jgi:shikimate kinase
MDSQASDEFRPPFRSALDNVNHDEKYTLTSVGNVDDSLTSVDGGRTYTINKSTDITTRSTVVTAKTTHILVYFQYNFFPSNFDGHKLTYN